MAYDKAAERVANKLAKGGYTPQQQRKLVSEWAKRMKAIIKGSK